MNYYLDTEFIEDFLPKSLLIPPFKWRQKQHYISLISIGIVAEDGREYSAVSKDFDLKYVWNKHNLLNPLEMGDEPEKEYWLRDNVLRPIWEDLRQRVNSFAKNHTRAHEEFTYKNLKTLISWYGKTNKQIATDIRCFTAGLMHGPATKDSKSILDTVDRLNKEKSPIFYGYYADYDWVLFCSLFGRMLDLPRGYPMYCKDLKQLLDEWVSSLSNSDFISHFHQSTPLTFEEKLKIVKAHNRRYPQQENEHHALADARWNKKLYKFLKETGAFHPEFLK